MFFHRVFLLTVVVGLVSCFPQPLNIPKLPSVPDFPNPSLSNIDVEIPNVSSGILDKIGLTGLLGFLRLLLSPFFRAKDSLPLPGNNDVMGYMPSLGNSDVPAVSAVGGSPIQMQELHHRISRLEAILKFEGRIQMVGNKIIATNGKEVYFATSNSTCNDVGGQIVTPMNEEENAAVLELVKKYNRYAYLGMTEGPIPGIFNYLNGASMVYTNWRENEPTGKGTEGCVEMYTDGQWNDKACNQKRLTICEF
ncbi:pulmonary surfactant-associated protein A-like isoform X1 [Bufo bufo]|uniref:pulmonary surfactant-associated protein A-like isoform X1 n=1 Tax=Bufo bufo TaxID=8384 RepID=UPI001ABED903|nr:pulmonary surfactant-associated protein A-like isoform X1 [Bufo bufo]XP_040293825.1 pulmonary surfactant-associated protein A-like isoform X1 [Bufo bufo]